MLLKNDHKGPQSQVALRRYLDEKNYENRKIPGLFPTRATFLKRRVKRYSVKSWAQIFGSLFYPFDFSVASAWPNFSIHQGNSFKFNEIFERKNSSGKFGGPKKVFAYFFAKTRRRRIFEENIKNLLKNKNKWIFLNRGPKNIPPFLFCSFSLKKIRIVVKELL